MPREAPAVGMRFSALGASAWRACHPRRRLRAGGALHPLVATRRAPARRASYCEIYNERVYDLLRWTRQPLAVRWAAAHGFHVPDLATRACTCMADILQARAPVLIVRCARRGMQHTSWSACMCTYT